MALNNLTKVQTLGIGSNIEVVGVITTGQFKSGTSNLHSSGVELTNLNVSGIATIGGNLSIGGTLTYQDVTNIDSVGLITARSGINVSGGQLDVGSNIKIGNAGVITATSFSGSGANLTGIDATAIKFGGAVKAQANAAGVVVTGILTASAFKLADGSNVGGVDSDAQENTLGGTNAGDSFSGTSALKNTLFGYDAGTAITTADVNTALGHSALKTNTQSSYNVAIGYESLKNFDRSDAGGQNTAVGWQSGDAMTSGRYNSLLGGASGGDITDGEQNSCFGYAAGRSITSGSTNTCIGYGAGKDSNQTGNNNIIIGNDAESSSTSVSNEITLGDSNINHFRVPGIGCSISAGGAVISGIVTATSFSGSGANLTNLPSSPPPNNFLINGAMQVNVRGTNHQTLGSFNPVTSSIYTLDRWKVLNHNSFDTDSAKVVQDNTAPTSEGFSKSIMMNIGNTETPSSTHVCGFQQMIEAQNLQSLAYGTSSAKTMTLSFWVFSNKTGTYCVQITQDDPSKFVLYEYTISSSNTWEKKTITIAGNTADAINNDNGIGFKVNWILCCGSARHNAATSTWTSGANPYATSNQVNLWDHPDNYFKMTGCQLQTGSTATDFVHEDIGTTLRKCQRYFYMACGPDGGGYETIGTGMIYYSGTGYANCYFPVTMRTQPSLVALSGSSGAYMYQTLLSNTAAYTHQISLDTSKTSLNSASVS